MKTSKPSLTALTHLAFHINAMLDACPGCDLSYAGIPEKLTSLEIALGAAAEVLRGRERAKANISKSGLCLVMAIILEAIQQQYDVWPTPPRSSLQEFEPHSPIPFN